MATYADRKTKAEPDDHDHPGGHKAGRCQLAPVFRRPNYFYGQMLGEREFRGEQEYFREKLKLHQRCLHGWGVVCGLDVTPGEEPPPCDPQKPTKSEEIKAEIEKLEEEKKAVANDPDKVKAIESRIEELRRALDRECQSKEREQPTSIVIHCGLALDCLGNEIVVREPRRIAISPLLSPEQRDRIQRQGAIDLYVSLCYCESVAEPVRPVSSGNCGPAIGCKHGWLVEEYRVRISTAPPDKEECPQCCGPCQDPCVLIAVIKGYLPGTPVTQDRIHTWVRRSISGYPPTTITGVSWVQGASYTIDESDVLLGTGDANCSNGLAIQFSRPIRVESLQPGVVDVWVIEGGGGRRFGFYTIGGEFVAPPAGTTAEFASRIVYRNITGEHLQDGDRVLIQVRTTFLLDECCRAVDGDHVGGRLPLLEDYRRDPYQKDSPWKYCLHPPGQRGPWQTGNGSPGGTFESWFFIREPAGTAKQARRRS